MRALWGLCLLIVPANAISAPDPAQEFSESIRPVLQQNCAGCHDPSRQANRVTFLSARTAEDIESQRGMWSSVAAQIRNRTMPPVASKITEEERLRISTWVENRLRETACSAGDYAGAVAPRRLNRREYRNTIRDLLGVDLAVAEIFPADESGGAGFDTHGETLYVPPMMLERYMEAAQKILDRVIVTPPLNKVFASSEMQPPLAADKPGRPLAPGEELSTEIPIYAEGEYNLRVSIERPKETPVHAELRVDGVAMGKLEYPRDRNGGPTARAQVVTLDRGVHKIGVVAGDLPILFYRLIVEQKQEGAHPEKAALHHRLFGMEPGEAPLEPRASARRLLQNFCAGRTGAPSRPRKSTSFSRSTTARPSAATLMKNA